MPTRRRWVQFSLRTFFVLLTALAAWLGIVVNRAREQRDAAKAIEALGGTLIYDWHLNYGARFDEEHGQWLFESKSKPTGPRWKQELFQTVKEVQFLIPSPEIDSEIREAIPHLQRLRSLETVRLFARPSTGVYEELKASLPYSEVDIPFSDVKPFHP